MSEKAEWGQNNRDRKDSLKSTVDEFAKGDYKTKNNTEKRKKCSQCGKGFIGRSDQSTCSGACRVAKHRA